MVDKSMIPSVLVNAFFDNLPINNLYPYQKAKVRSTLDSYF